MKKRPRVLDLSQIEDELRKERLGKVPEQYRPSPTQYLRWKNWINWSMEPDPEGWWYGWCPIGDKTKAGTFSVMINFHYGSMKCKQEISCHPDKGGMSLSNAMVAAARPSMAHAETE